MFRRIYDEETEGRSGTFSVRRGYGEGGFKNSEAFSELGKELLGPAGFLLKQLFDVGTLELGDSNHLEESALRSRACFNHGNPRNLEGYLKLIVRFVTPEPQETFVLYQKAVERVRKGTSIVSVLTSPDFKLEYAHDQFWSLLVNQSHDFTSKVAHDAIDTLVDYLPRYSTIGNNNRGLRQRSTYTLLRLLDRAGWGRTAELRLPNSPENIIEIAWRIFGENSHEGKGLLNRLVSGDRSVLGWNDLMTFRLQCSADRQGQLYNLHSALIIHQDSSAATSGRLSDLALTGMRRLSQEVFALFKRTYIDSQRNFFAEASDVPLEDFLGESPSQLARLGSNDSQFEPTVASFTHRVSVARAVIKSFVIYQLTNRLAPNGSGVGCGFYDESGTGDKGGIANLMNGYVFDVCFNPEIHEDNVLHFLDNCLSHLSNSLDEEGFFASKTALPGGFDPNEMGRYWSKHQEIIRQRAQLAEERCVVTPNYKALYREGLPGVFAVLDELAKEV